jgi:hypothetical protein
VKPGRFLVVVRPPAKLRARYRAVTVIVVVAAKGTARVIRR